MNSPHHPHDVHQQRLLWFFSFCNQRSSSSSSSSGGSGSARRGTGGGSRRKSASSRNKFALQYQYQLQQQQRQSSNVFGRELLEHTQLYSDDDSVPHIVKACARFIEKHGIIFGIYRLSGMRVNIHKLRQDFDKNPKISMIDSEAISNDAHAVACVLKQYFRELPTPLLTFQMYEKLIELFKHKNNNNINANNNNINNDNRNIDDISINNNQDQNNLDHDNTNCGNDPSEALVSSTTAAITTTNKSTSSQMNTKSKSPSIQQQSAATAIATTQTKKQSQFTTSASDSQLISLSSVVTTTTSDVKYQVKLDDLRRLLTQLPRSHYQTLKFLMRHLACIATNGQKTGMDSKNVAIVWAPNLLKPQELELSAGLETLQIIGLQAVITEQLIKHHKFLFKDDIDKNPTSESRDDTRLFEIAKIEESAEKSHRHYGPNQDQQQHQSQSQSQPLPQPSAQQQQQQLPSKATPQPRPESMHNDREQAATTTRDADSSCKDAEERDENEENNFQVTKKK